MANRLLGIYMNDQLALGVLWRELARRAERNNAGSEAGTAIAAVADAIAEDVATFESLMDRLRIRRNPVKPRLAIVAERLGRGKLNGRLMSYSPLSRFMELDVLIMGIHGKVTLWTNLRDPAGLGELLPDVDFDALIERARRQRSQLEAVHAEAGREALGGRSQHAADAVGPRAHASTLP